MEMNNVDLVCNATCINQNDGRCERKFIRLDEKGNCIYCRREDKRINAESVKEHCDEIIKVIDGVCDECKDQSKCADCRICELSGKLGNITGLVERALKGAEK